MGGNPELIKPGERGLLFDPGDAGQLAGCLLQLAGDRDLRLRLAAAGQQFLHRNFALSTAADTMANIYSSFLQAAPRAGKVQPAGGR